MTPAGAAGPLVERGAHVEAATARLTAALGGRGGVVVLDGLAGHGKTRLLRALRSVAADAGARVLHATGAELERDFAFGVVRQLLERELLGADPARRGRLLGGAAVHAAGVFDLPGPEAPPDDVAHRRRHGVFWLVANLAEEQPLVLAVDDAHWADRASLGVLDALGRRVADLPVLLLVAARPAEPGAEQDLLDAVAAGPEAEVLRLGSLSAAGVAEVVRESFDAADDAFVEACRAATDGNPLLLVELLRELHGARLHGAASEVDTVRRTAPSTVGRLVVGRLRRLSPDALAFARAMTILGERRRIDQVAALAGLGSEAAAPAHAALAGVGLVEPDAPRFIHPLVAQAIAADLVASERSAWHRRAARLLADAGLPAAEVVAHLVLSAPEGDPEAARLLQEAGVASLADGAPDVAVRLLRRAAEEFGTADERLLLDLGRAELAAGDGRALADLTTAAQAGDPRLAAAAEHARAGLLVMDERRAESVAGLRRALDRLGPGDDDLRAALQEDLLGAIQYDADFLDLRRELLARGAAEGRPAVLAHLTLDRALEGATAQEVLGLARRALGDGRLMQERGVATTAYWNPVEALMAVEAAGEARSAIDAAAAEARRTGSRLAAAYVAAMRTHWELAFGDLRVAEDEARSALELFGAPDGGPAERPTLPGLAAAQLARGDVDGAEAVLRRLPGEEQDRPAGTYVRRDPLWARVLLARGRADEALVRLDRQAAVERARGWVAAPRDDTPVLRGAVLAALGRDEEAREHARAVMASAQARGLRSLEALAGLAAARTLAREDAIDRVRELVTVARGGPRGLVLAEALADLGGLLRRDGDRVASRGPLREALDLAHRHGATSLEARVREELLIAGARPQRTALAGVDGLTAAERRVAELAAQGLRNRDIAEALFVTPKTVEVHLSRVYSKLGIRGRAGIAAGLGLEPAAVT